MGKRIAVVIAVVLFIGIVCFAAFEVWAILRYYHTSFF
jgi:hypothetical protein